MNHINQIRKQLQKQPSGSAMVIVLIVVIMLVVAVLLFFVLNRNNKTTAPTTSDPAATQNSSTNSSTSTSEQTTVSIKDMAFSPKSVTVKKGSTIVWTNNDSTPHTVTATGGSFSSGTLGSGKTFSQTFNTVGTFTYKCTIHPDMTGTVIVTE